jgi:hypothetical protein
VRVALVCWVNPYQHAMHCAELSACRSQCSLWWTHCRCVRSAAQPPFCRDVIGKYAHMTSFCPPCQTNTVRLRRLATGQWLAQSLSGRGKIVLIISAASHIVMWQHHTTPLPCDSVALRGRLCTSPAMPWYGRLPLPPLSDCLTTFHEPCLVYVAASLIADPFAPEQGSCTALGHPLYPPHRSGAPAAPDHAAAGHSVRPRSCGHQHAPQSPSVQLTDSSLGPAAAAPSRAPDRTAAAAQAAATGLVWYCICMRILQARLPQCRGDGCHRPRDGRIAGHPAASMYRAADVLAWVDGRSWLSSGRPHPHPCG